jgi:lactate dehydrogenase-like 2-hydroxyacid dehydrogenase
VDPLTFDELARSEVVVANVRGVLDRRIAEFELGSILARPLRAAGMDRRGAGRTERVSDKT